MRQYRSDLDPQRKVALLNCAANGLTRTESARFLGLSRDIVDKQCRRDREIWVAFNTQERPNTGSLDLWLRAFWERVEVRGANECWLWSGSVNPKSGYPKLFVSKQAMRWLKWPQKHSYPYRVAYYLHHGVIDHALTIDHICHTPRCCNPAHLRQCTLQENAGRKWFHVLETRPDHLKPLDQCKHHFKPQLHEKALSPEREQGDSPSRPANDKQSAKASSEARSVPVAN